MATRKEKCSDCGKLTRRGGPCQHCGTCPECGSTEDSDPPSIYCHLCDRGPDDDEDLEEEDE